MEEYSSGTLRQLLGSISEVETLTRFVETLYEDHANASVVLVFEIKANLTFLVISHGVVLVTNLGIVGERTVESFGNNEIPFVVLNYRKTQEFVYLALFEVGVRVQVWSKSKTGKCDYVKLLEGSPANASSLEEYFGLDDNILNNVDAFSVNSSSNNSQTLGSSVAVRFAQEDGQLRLGVAFYEIGDSSFLTGEFCEDETFALCESILVSLQAKEIFYCPADLQEKELRKFRDMTARLNFLMTPQDRKEFESSLVVRDLTKVLGDASIPPSTLEQTLVLQALAVLLKCCGLVPDLIESNDEHLSKPRFLLKPLEMSQYLRLDAACIRGLDLLPLNNRELERVASSVKRKDSLYGILNKTKTAMGSRLLKKWLLMPLQNIEEIEKRQNVVETFIENAIFRTEFRDRHLKFVPDLARLCRRFQKLKNVTLRHVICLYQLSIRLPLLLDCFSQYTMADDSSPLKPYWQRLISLHTELDRFEELIEATIDLDLVQNNEYVVSARIDENLSEMMRVKDEILAEIAVVHEDVCSHLNLKTDKLKLERKESAGFFFRLSRKDERLVRGNPHYVILETRKDGIRFVTKALNRLSERYFCICTEYDKKQEEMENKIIQVVASYISVFEEASLVLAELDVLSTFAIVAVDAPEPYCRPSIDQPRTGICLIQARHPIVEENLEGKQFIANDCFLENVSDSDDRLGQVFIVVTGPNMGGKSTYIRTVGVITLMAHIGCFVPAKSARIALTDRILCRIGSTDYQMFGVSTFMAEMLETSSILRLASPSSLIIVDELGRGTCTEEGFGLAYSIAEYIVQHIGCPCMFATHFHELAFLADTFPQGVVQNVHMSAEPDPETQKLQFLYKVEAGICDKSFGIHVAELARFPASVLQDAKDTVDRLEKYGIGEEDSGNKTCSSEKKEAYHFMKWFLAKVQYIQSSSQTESQKKEAIDNLKEVARRSSNKYIQSIL
ncbi:DNA mismatch repair protein msh-2 [Galdieria sulphuraria]|nr:DNA mismatch repair protein msh-2 [Galdieria sulphuraria]